MSTPQDGRLGSLGDILRDRPTRPRLEAAPEPVPATPTQPHSSTAPATKAPSATGSCRVPVKLDPQLRDKLAAQVANDGSTNARVAFDAIDQALNKGILAQLVEQTAAPHRADPPQSSRFQGTPRRQEPRPTVTVEFRMTLTDRDTLDQITQEVGARDRTHLITTALVRHLA